jgi:hypothetical protein
MKLIGYVVAACIILAGLAGCSSESRQATMHTPGVYKGADDPLLAKQPQQQALIDRFKMVQTDR